MCGFLVQFSQKDDDFNNFEIANDLLDKRGPDSTGYYKDSENHKFGFKRLSILDLDASANQPMVDHQNRYVIVFNGEVYNFKQLRNEIEQSGGSFLTSHSDTEAILEGYKIWGSDILDKLEGQFSFVIFDKVNRTLFMARDRVGQKPLFYKITKESIIISSTLEPIIKLTNSFEVDLESVYTFLQVGVIPAPKTIFKNINKLKNGEFITFDVQSNHILEKRIYWSPEQFIDYKKFDYDEFISIFDEAVKKRCVADVEISSFLSGGLDSTAIIKKASKYLPSMNTFSVGFLDKKFDESYWAEMASNKFDIPNTLKKIDESLLLKILPDSLDAYDEPFYDSSSIPTFLVSKLMSNISKVALSGDGGDELLGGYQRYTWSNYNNYIPFPLKTPLSFISNQMVKNNSISTGTNQYLSMLNKNSSERYASFFIDKNFTDILGISDFSYDFISNNWLETEDDFKSMQATDYNFYLPEVMMTKIDRASMANSLEIRSPFVDHKLIEYILSVQSKGYTATRNKKKPLKKFLSDDFDDNFLSRKKMGFAVPLDTWIKSSLREEVFNTLDNQQSFVKQELNFDTSNLFDKLEQGQKSYKNRIWKLFVLEKNIQKYLTLLH
tara:strand:- start:594 stop:2423 length:1830 start_codon:yes stop_codon:yes gene_type:complete